MRTITRQTAIDELRTRMKLLVDDAHCMCEVAAREGILCHGFARWSYADLKRRFWWIALRHPDVARAEFERLANTWLAERQRRFGMELTCDAQTIEHDICRGWHECNETMLARYVRELSGEEVSVVPDGETGRPVAGEIQEAGG